MKKTVLTAAACIGVLAGPALAQDAFITQLGDNNSATNYAEYFVGGQVTQVIAQQGDGFSAANFSRGGGNSAYAYQILEAGVQGAPTGNSLIWQSTSSFAQGNNTAIHVQRTSQSPGTNGDFTAQTIQEGINNTAVNWAQNAGGAMAGVSLGTVTMPSIALSPGTSSIPAPSVSAALPFGTTVSTN